MICIYREYHRAPLETEHGRQLNCKAKWSETTAENLRNAILAVVHAPYLQPPVGPLMIEVDGVLYDLEFLPKGKGKDLLLRCRYWLLDRQRVQKNAMVPRPVFGL